MAESHYFLLPSRSEPPSKQQACGVHAGHVPALSCCALPWLPQHLPVNHDLLAVRLPVIFRPATWEGCWIVQAVSGGRLPSRITFVAAP